MKITTVGIDLAKSVFQIHGVDERGKAVLRKQLKRAEMPKFFANLPPCLIGMEACGSAHYWARKLIELGHTVKLMAPQFRQAVREDQQERPQRCGGDLRGGGRPNMRFVPVKSAEQQALLALHRARSGWVKARTAQANQIRGLLGEFGIVLPQGIVAAAQPAPRDSGGWRQRPAGADARAAAARCWPISKHSISRSQELEREIVLGIGATRTAADWSASAASGRSPPAPWWPASAMPRPSRTAGRWPPGWGWCRDKTPPAARPSCWASASMAMCICARCSSTARAAVLRHVEHRPDQTDSWLVRLVARRNRNVAAVALANKNARIAWALLAHQRDFEPDYVSTAPTP